MLHIEHFDVKKMSVSIVIGHFYSKLFHDIAIGRGLTS
jgi:hypothetical protein